MRLTVYGWSQRGTMLVVNGRNYHEGKDGNNAYGKVIGGKFYFEMLFY